MNKRKIVLEEDETLFNGTIVKKKDVAYYIPISMMIVGVIFGLSGFKPGWWIFGLGALMVILLSVKTTPKTK